MEKRNTFSKSERLHSQKLIDELFNGGHSRGMSAFPLRMVYMKEKPDGAGDTTVGPGDKEGTVAESDAPAKDAATAPTQVLISVPKRLLKRANKRNLVKRQVREAYRTHKHLLDGATYRLAFIWLDSKTWTGEQVTARVVNLLHRLSERKKKKR